jgi:hypothetical protein
MKCQNNLKQMGIAFHAHHDVTGFLPTSGTEVPDDGTDNAPANRLNWGWAYEILPYIEQGNLQKVASNAVVRATVVPDEARPTTDGASRGLPPTKAGRIVAESEPGSAGANNERAVGWVKGRAAPDVVARNIVPGMAVLVTCPVRLPVAGVADRCTVTALAALVAVAVAVAVAVGLVTGTGVLVAGRVIVAG